MSFHVQYVDTRPMWGHKGCDEDGWLDSANVYEFPVQHFNTQQVPESDWHLLQQLVSVGFKFYILLYFTNISKDIQ